jgi:hypothetical protein
MKTCFKVFHTKGCGRDKLFEEAHSYLLHAYTPLLTPTIAINCRNVYEEYFAMFPELKVYNRGYCPGKKEDMDYGWKYGELGIWYSNWLAWKNFLSTDADVAILAEDDVIFDKDFYAFFNRCMMELPPVWEIMSFHSPDPHFYEPCFDIGLPVVCKSYQTWSALCYAVNRSGARRMLDYLSVILWPLDWYLFRGTFKSYSYKPDIAPPCAMADARPSFRNDQKRIIL